ncbi:MAG: long-chain-fatty-acid--CoA ligase [Parahaliea sp.]
MYLTQGLHRSVQCNPNGEAIRFQGSSITYRQLADRVARLAGALRQLGVKPGDRVAMLSLNSPQYLEYYMAVPWADAVLNPINTRWSVAEVVYSLDDSATSVLIVDDTFLAMGREVFDKAKTLGHLIYTGETGNEPDLLSYEQLLHDAEPVEDVRRGGDALAGVFYTGGTTGFPKGVMLSHMGLCAGFTACLLSGSCGRDRHSLQVMPLFHLAGMAGIMMQYISGGRHVVIPAFEPELVLETMSTEGVTDVTLAPTMLQMLLDWREAHPERTFDFSSLKNIAYGASPISPTQLDRAREAFPSAEFRQGYGMTELSTVATALGAEYHSAAGQASGRMYSAGRAVECVEVRIVDADDNEVARGTIGEIIARGPNVMLGYWNKPEATAEAVRNGWMHTGDAGYMDEDGFVYVVDRLKDMIVSGGENIYSAEVETALNSHPAVSECAVIAIPSDKWGETVHAAIVLKAAQEATEDDLLSHCRERIAGYKCPRSFEFRDAMPLTSVGKVSKADLRKPYWEGRGRGVT